MRASASAAIGAGPAAASSEESTPHVRPAEGERDGSFAGQHAIAAVAVDLQGAAEAGEMGDRSLGLAVGRVDVDDRRRVGAAPGAVVAGVGPELADLGAPAAGVEDRRGGLVGEELRGGPQDREKALVDGTKMEGRAPDPVGQRGAVQPDALPRVDLRLAVQRQVIGVFGDEDERDRRLGRQAALDQSGRCRLLDDDVLAGPAGIAGPARDQDAELGRDDVEPLRAILTDLVERAAAARTALVVEVADGLDARQMGRQGTTIGSPLGRGRAACRLASCFRRRRVRRGGLLHILQPEQQLILGQRLGATTEAMALHRLDDLFQPLGAQPLGDQHRLQRLGIVGERDRHARHDRTQAYSPAPREPPAEPSTAKSLR